MSEVCQHGSLRDKCEICERDDIIASACELFASIERDEVNARDEATKWLRDFFNTNKPTFRDRSGASAQTSEADVRAMIEGAPDRNGGVG